MCSLWHLPVSTPSFGQPVSLIILIFDKTKINQLARKQTESSEPIRLCQFTSSGRKSTFLANRRDAKACESFPRQTQKILKPNQPHNIQENFELANHLRIAGIVGLIGPFFCFVCILLAIYSWPRFNWTNNALSDLGVQSGITAITFNSGLVVSGILLIIFATGLFALLCKYVVGRVGASVFILSCISLIGIGIFNESFSPMHYILSVAFFVLFPVSMLILVGAFLINGSRRLSVFTFAVALAAAIVWGLQLIVQYVSNVAIPEFISGLFGSMWVVILGYVMLKKSEESSSLPHKL